MMRIENKEMNTNNALVEKLRSMKKNGATIFELLEQIRFIHKEDPLIKPLSMKYFREAFGLSLPEVTPLGGWCGLGGELSNEQISELIKPCFKD
jgi:hypothetical protein